MNLSEIVRSAVPAAPPPPAKKKSPYGLSVVDGVPRYTSASSLTTADPRSYAGCLRRWWYAKVGKIEEPETKGQALGTKQHDAIDKFYQTGVRAFGPIVMAGARYIDAPGPDLEFEQEVALPFGSPRVERDAPVDPTTSPVRAAGIPLVGRLDQTHARRLRINRDGELVADADVGREIKDWKTTKDLAYAKSPEELRSLVQMDVYDRWARLRDPSLDRVRRTLVYFTTKTPYQADLVSAVLDADESARRWEYVESVARTLRDATREIDPDKVDGNRRSCDAYRGCPHRKICSYGKFNSLASAGFSAAVQVQTRTKESDVSLFEELGGKTAPVPSPPVLDMLDVLDAQEAAARASKSVLTDDLRAAFKYIDAAGLGCPVLKGDAAAARSEYTGATMTVGGVLAGSGKLAGVEAIETLAKVLELANALRARAAKQAAPAPAAPPPAIVPAAAAPNPVVSPQTPASRPDLAALPAPGLPAPPPSPVAADAPPPAAEAPKKKGAKVAPAQATAMVLYIDCAPSTGYTSLDPLRGTVNSQLTAKYECDPPDVRCAGDKSGIGFGKWKGAVEATARAIAAKLPRGHYVIRTRGDEVAQAIACGLETAEVDGAPVFDSVVRSGM